MSSSGGISSGVWVDLGRSRVSAGLDPPQHSTARVAPASFAHTATCDRWTFAACCRAWCAGVFCVDCACSLKCLPLRAGFMLRSRAPASSTGAGLQACRACAGVLTLSCGRAGPQAPLACLWWTPKLIYMRELQQTGVSAAAHTTVTHTTVLSHSHTNCQQQHTNNKTTNKKNRCQRTRTTSTGCSS